MPERDPLPRLLAFVYAPVLLALGALLGSGTVRLAALPPCALLNATGIACPTCGGTRAGLALWHFDLVEALIQNPLVALGLLGLGLWFAAAVVMTCVPAWRYALRLTPGEWSVVRVVGLLFAALTWAYEIVRHLVGG